MAWDSNGDIDHGASVTHVDDGDIHVSGKIDGASLGSLIAAGDIRMWMSPTMGTAEVKDAKRSVRPATKHDRSLLFEIANVLVRLNHIGSFIVNRDHSIM